MRKPKKEIAVVPLRPDPCNGLTTGGHSGLPFETVALVLQGGGPLPENIYEVQERQKDIQYSSRTRAMTDIMATAQHYRRMLREVLAQVPPQVRSTHEWCQEAEKFACAGQYSVIQLIYQDKEWEGLAKDYEFSPETMHEHWSSGLLDIQRTLTNTSWLQLPPDGREFMTYDLHRQVAPAASAVDLGLRASI